jgi:hypothetical protein
MALFFRKRRREICFSISFLLLRRGHFKGARSPTVSLVADLFHPLDDFTVKFYLNGDMGHRRGCRRTMHWKMV